MLGTKFRLFAVLLIILAFLPLGFQSSLAQGIPALKSASPEVEVKPVEVKPAPKAKSSATLQGSVERTGKASKPKLHKAGANVDAANTRVLRAKIREQKLKAIAESGVGIIGVKFIMTNGQPPMINRVFPGTPASEVGMRPFDVIVAVDGVPTYGLSKEEVYDLIIGVPGTDVTLSIQRSGDFTVHKVVRMDLNDIKDPIVRRDYMTQM
jgi:C-terminal processing protease CtpA/Prc